MRRRGIFLALATILLSYPIWVWAIEWNGLKVGVSNAAEAKRVLGKPVSEYPDSLLFSGSKIRSKLNPDTIVVNINQAGTIESIIIFPLWGTTEVEIHKVYGEGQIMTYEHFLKHTGRTHYGAGTRPEQKLHYVQLDNKCEFYNNRNVLVIYDQRELASEHDVVKLVVIF